MKTCVIGGNGTVGTAALAALRVHGHEVVVASRSSDPAVDITDPESIANLFETVGVVDAVVCAVGATPFKVLTDLSHEDLRSALLGKALSQMDVVRIGIPYLRDGGSFTLTTGILAREPIATGVAASAANGAVESFVMAASTELPRGIRLNAVSPTVLEDAPGYHSAFPGFIPVSSARVGAQYLRSVAGVETGTIFKAE